MLKHFSVFAILVLIFTFTVEARPKKKPKVIPSEFIEVTPGTVNKYTAEGKHGITYHVYIPTSYNEKKPPPPETIDEAIAWIEKDWMKYGSKKKLKKRI